VGLARDEESLVASTYANRLPADLSGRAVFVLDPMLATGGTLETVFGMLIDRGAGAVSNTCRLITPVTAASDRSAPQGPARHRDAFHPLIGKIALAQRPGRRPRLLTWLAPRSAPQRPIPWLLLIRAVGDGGFDEVDESLASCRRSSPACPASTASRACAAASWASRVASCATAASSRESRTASCASSSVTRARSAASSPGGWTGVWLR